MIAPQTCSAITTAATATVMAITRATATIEGSPGGGRVPAAGRAAYRQVVGLSITGLASVPKKYDDDTPY